MKLRTRILSALLAGVMVLSLSLPTAVAVEGTDAAKDTVAAEGADTGEGGDAAKDAAAARDADKTEDVDVDEDADAADKTDVKEEADTEEDAGDAEDTDEADDDAAVYTAADKISVPDVKGNISATLRLDYAQKLSEIEKRDVNVTLKNGDKALGTIDLWDGSITGMKEHPVSYYARNSDGGELGGSEWPGYLDVTVSNLPLGEYTLAFSGTGYVPFEQKVELKDYSQTIVLGNGDGTFGLGNVNSDEKVDAEDKAALTKALGSQDEDLVAKYDLNGDGKINIIDLAYVSRQIKAEGDAVVYNTALLAPDVNTAELEENMKVTGDLADMFQDNDASVTLSATGGESGTLDIPIAFNSKVEMKAIEIVTPESNGTIQKGTVTVELADGETITQEFDNTLPEDIHAISRTEGSNIVTINLGKKVAVKKVTISVSMDDNQNYVVVDTIRFLQDIVPENPVAPNTKVKSIAATAGDSQVTLKWGGLPNVTGYQIRYKLKSGGEEKQLLVDIPTAVVTGLKNLETYVFTVIPISDGWEGQVSDQVEATPLPAKTPDAPDMVNVQAQDGALSVSWGKSKNATSYEVYYTDVKDAAIKEYTCAGDALTELRTVIGDLKNGTPYYVYVVAVNSMGKSKPSKIVTGTPVAVVYGEPAGLPKDLTRITRDQMKSIALKDQGSYSSSKSTKPFTTDYLMDNNYETNWTSQSYGDGNYTRSKQIIYTFTQPVDLSYVVYVPRQDGGYENSMRLYGVTVWCDGDDLNGTGTTLVTMNGKDKTPVKGKMGNAEDGYFVALPFPVTKNITKIAVDIEQTGYGAVGLAEVIFYEYDEEKALDGQIDALFADDAHTNLTEGVTQEKITALTESLDGSEGYYLDPNTMKDELALAAELLAEKNSGVVLKGISARSSGADSKQYGQGGSDLQPLGVAAQAGQTITVYAQGIPEGETVTVLATQYHAEAAAWQSKVGELQNGRNVFTVPKIGSQTTSRGGSLYFTYSGKSGDAITLHTRRATDVPVLELGNWYQLDETGRKNVIAQYVDELNKYKITDKNKKDNYLNVTEISMPTVLLSLPATAVQDNTSKSGAEEQAQILYNNVLAWEQLMHVTKTTQGIDNTLEKNDMTSRQNIRYMQMFAGAFMYAAGSHVGVEYGSCGALACGKPVDDATENSNKLFGWGIAHEIGHNMDKLGKAECTNNIYSLMVQTYDGKDNTLTSRLEGGKYEDVFQKVAQGYPGTSNDVFVQLGMYWQLHLAYDNGQNDGNGPLDFYNRFFKTWKAGDQFNGAKSYDDKVALVASYTAQTDLTDFFTHWGMQLSEETKAKLKTYGDKESRAIWYLNDNSRRDRLQTVKAGAGTITAQANKKDDNEVVLTLNAALTDGKLQGYEIRRNGKSIGFTTGETYTDVIGSANHMNFTYTVQAYDTLGNPIGDAVTAGEIRVAYDKTVDKSTYDLVRDGSTVTITMKNNATPVSGIKLTGTGLPNTGAYTVTATVSYLDDSQKEIEKNVTVKQGDYSKNEAVDDLSSYLAYFNKPGAEASDTRIWTYDVKELVMTNVPEGAELQLISYAGDDVAFTENGAVGRLTADYKYGDGKDDVIQAGTLVVTGTYRGDPVYNTLRVKGSFTNSVVDETGEQTTKPVERYLDGYALFFAEIPTDGEVGDISDGIFLFVPNVQNEAELQGEQSNCEMDTLLPTRMMVEFYRTDDPKDASSRRLTASTSWIYTPGGENLPTIVLKGDGE